ncbi:hypothetical protein ABTM85_20570, partial [Acinetobacter baumannii]
ASRRRAEENLRRATEVRPAPTPAPVAQPAPAKKAPPRERGSRSELHLSEGKGGSRREKKSKKPTGQIRVETSHGFEKPTAPVIREV